ncbi:MAG: hypothetical protein H0U50_13205 [Pyrinomonadaceae bacterium]|nr:hypothetical protein [Pyrinomonadaceae bacterium]
MSRLLFIRRFRVRARDGIHFPRHSIAQAVSIHIETYRREDLSFICAL